MLNKGQVFFFCIEISNRFDLFLYLSFFRTDIDFDLIVDSHIAFRYPILEWRLDIYYNPDYQLISWILDAYGFELDISNSLRKRIRRKQ